MLGLMIHWELPFSVAVNNRALSKYLKIWTHTAKAFSCSDLIIIDLDGSCPIINDSEINISYYNNNDDALKDFKSIKHIYVDIEGESINDFIHPEEAVYIIGSDYTMFTKPPKSSIIGFNSKIPTHAFIAAGIILSSR